MGSARQQDRSLGGGISLPQWMKGKIDNKFDFDESTFSPPSHDDSFFYVRYSKTKAPQTSVPAEEFQPIEETTSSGKKLAVSVNRAKAGKQVGQQAEQQQQRRHVSDSKEIREIDFSKHPLPCQPFIASTAANGGKEGTSPRNTAPGNIKAKSQGTDDGFHSEAALCGKSIVHVATQIMSNKFGKTFAAAEQANIPPKKGSKSLPATPLTSPVASPDSSPKARRRVPSNRYFTGPFVPDRDKYQGGWILASILGQSREIVAAKIDEEDESGIEVSAPARTLSRKKSISSQNLTYLGNDDKTPGKSSVHGNVFQAKPSELREMNFWSPTSM